MAIIFQHSAEKMNKKSFSMRIVWLHIYSGAVHKIRNLFDFFLGKIETKSNGKTMLLPYTKYD